MKLPLITIIDTELNRGTYMGKQPVGLDDFCLRITEEYKRYGADVYTIPRDYYSSWVARRGDSLPMGWVTFQDKNRYKNNTEEKWMYTVSSDNITNNQFSTGGDDHHSYTTVSADKALKLVRKYFTSYTPTQTLGHTLWAMEDAISLATRKLEREKEEKATAAFGPRVNKDVERFMRDVYVTDRDRLPVILQNNIQDVLAAEADFAETVDGRGTCYYVMVDDRTQQQLQFSVIPLAQRKGSYRMSMEINGRTIKYTVDELPEKIKGALSVLAMMEAKTLVEHVGMRMDEGIAYVYG
jgi:hypothetical protein